MTVYDVVLFLHITSAMIMFASLTVDWLAIAGLRVTWTAERARIWIRALEVSAAFGVWARLAVLGAGLYLAVDANVLALETYGLVKQRCSCTARDP